MDEVVVFALIQQARGKVQLAKNVVDSSVRHMHADIALTQFLMDLSVSAEMQSVKAELLRLIDDYNSVGKNYE